MSRETRGRTLALIQLWLIHLASVGVGIGEVVRVCGSSGSRETMEGASVMRYERCDYMVESWNIRRIHRRGKRLGWQRLQEPEVGFGRILSTAGRAVWIRSIMVIGRRKLLGCMREG